MPPRCVKCAGDHPSSQCNRPKTPDPQLPPKCVNCLKSHTANYRGCEAFPHNKIKTARHSTRDINPNISFAQITTPQPSAISRPSKETQSTTNPTPYPPQNLNSPSDVPVLQDMAGVLSDIQQLLGINDFLDMYNKLIDIRNQLKHLNSHENRLFLFFNSVLSLQNKPVSKP
jgi:hypothetical protein